MSPKPKRDRTAWYKQYKAALVVNSMYAYSMDWLEDNMADLSAIRDVSSGTRFVLTFNTKNGCTAEVQGESIQDCVRKARELEGEDNAR